MLQTYRCVCDELYKKRAVVDSLNFQRLVLDRGRTLDGQVELQLSIARSLAGRLKSLQELTDLRHRFYDAIAHGTTNNSLASATPLMAAYR